ncbi:hypothetical protein [Methylosoma difficile]
MGSPVDSVDKASVGGCLGSLPDIANYTNVFGGKANDPVSWF